MKTSVIVADLNKTGELMLVNININIIISARKGKKASDTTCLGEVRRTDVTLNKCRYKAHSKSISSF